MAFNPDDYRNPQCRIFVGGSELKRSDCHIEQVNVQLSVSSKANSADVTIIADYDYKNSGVGGELLSKLSAGKKVRIAMGYQEADVVFMGYINTVSLSFSEQGVTVSFSCLDARGLLMGNTSWKAHEKESAKQIVEALLNPLKSYVAGMTVKIPGEADPEQPLPQNNLDDFRYICRLAKLTYSVFYMNNTELKFIENNLRSVSPSHSYKWGRDIIKFDRTVDLSNQVGSVTVNGNFPDTVEDFSSTVSPPTGGGKTVAQLNSDVKQKELTVDSYSVKNPKEAQAYASSMMFESALNICSGTAVVLGNEHLLPGEGVSFEGLDSDIDGDYLITSVSHSFGSGGFISTIGFNRTTA